MTFTAAPPDAALRRLSWLHVSIAVLLVPVTMAYRLATDGLLGGFTNDDFVHLSRAQQIVLGDLPVRDFFEIGMPLTEAASAAAQAALGRTLFSEFLLAAGLLGASAAVLFMLAARASGSILIGLAVALMQIAMEPRFYNYPKLLTYALAIPFLWRYIDRPTPLRGAWLGGVTALAFLFRHDHGIYVGAAAGAAVVAAHWGSVHGALRGAVAVCAAAAAVAAPYLVFVQVHGGVVDYVQSAAQWAARDARRTARPPQRLHVDWSAPLVALEPPPAPRINVRWTAGVTREQRAELERSFGLTLVAQRAGDVATYTLADWSPSRLESIVRDPAVADTHGVDRRTFAIDDPAYAGDAGVLRRARILPGVLNGENALPFLFFLFFALPLVALAMVLFGAGASDDRLAPFWRSKVIVVAVLALLVNAGFLRGALASRIMDVTVPAGVLLAWVAGRLLLRSGGLTRLPAAAAVLVLAVLVTASVEATSGVAQRIRVSGATSGSGALAQRLLDGYARLSATPPAAAYEADQAGTPRLARYLMACTAPRDRLLVIGYAPELFVLSGRGFAGGHHSVQPGFLGSAADQQRTIARIERARVPVVVTVPEAEYVADYLPAFPALDAFLAGNYREAGTVDLLNGVEYRVLVRRDLVPTGRYDLLGLPCYGEGA